MKDRINIFLQGFDYDSVNDFTRSLIPTLKYKAVLLSVTFSSAFTTLDLIFGLDAMAVLALCAIMLLELVSGIYASYVNKVPFSSARLSRFTFKCACYLVLIAVPYLFATSYNRHNNSLAASFFEWLHVFLVVQIVVENVFSVLENVAVIQGKDKTFWIEKIKDKINNFFQ